MQRRMPRMDFLVRRKDGGAAAGPRSLAQLTLVNRDVALQQCAKPITRRGNAVPDAVLANKRCLEKDIEAGGTDHFQGLRSRNDCGGPANGHAGTIGSRGQSMVVSFERYRQSSVDRYHNT